jgi:hypothetical protein
LGNNLSITSGVLNAAGGSGGVTSITAGAGLTGGTITTSGTISIAAHQSLSKHVIYASAAGCALNTNLLNGGGTDDSVILNAILATAPTLTALELIIDGPALINSPLRIFSNTTITFLPGAGLFCGQGTNGPALANAHWVSSFNNGSPIYDGSTIVDKNITIRGPGFINGNRGNGTTGNCTSGNFRSSAANPNNIPVGMLISNLMFFGVRYLNVSDITSYTSPCYQSWYANCFTVRIQNFIAIDPEVTGSNPEVFNNSDGMHFNGPVDDLEIIGCFLQAGDDGIALNAADGNLQPGDGGGGFGGFQTVYAGPITRVNVVGIRYNPAQTCFRLLNGPYLIDQVSAYGLSGTIYEDAFINAAPFGTIPLGGTISRVHFDMDVDALEDASPPTAVALLGAIIEDFELTCRRNSGSGFVMLPVSINGTIERVNLHLDTIDQGSTAAGALVQVTGGTLANLNVDGYWSRPGQSQGTNPLISVTGGTVTGIRVSNMTVSNAGGIVEQTGGTISALNVNNCTALNLGSGTGISTTGTIASLSGTGNVGVTTSGAFTTNTFSSQ